MTQAAPTWVKSMLNNGANMRKNNQTIGVNIRQSKLKTNVSQELKMAQLRNDSPSTSAHINKHLHLLHQFLDEDRGSFFRQLVTSCKLKYR